MPFWSSRSRVQRIIATVPAYAGFEPVEIPWDEFRESLVSELKQEGTLAGVNWSGPRSKGFDMEPERLVQCVLAIIEQEP